ncbi:MAG: PAS domain-containing sensor histidine kinase, partial [Paramuribaculum sp.]|nr:PAS domain-containing sensor histidine kinase [Paramuribaculum sp.]
FKGEVATAIAETKQGESRTVRFSDTKIVRISRLNFLELGFARPYVMVEVLTNEVIKAEKDAYGKVIRLIAHEVNNTMAGVNSMLETLALIMEQEADLAEAIESCRERCASMSEFITSYADVVRIPEAKLDRLELNGRIARMIPFLEGLAGENIRLNFTPAEDEVFVKADTVLLEQVMVNIVKNSKESILSSTGEGEINISVKERPKRIEITDNGAGISGEAAPRLFSPFFSTKRGGQGIGLMMVGDILRQHKCKFSLRTDPPAEDNPAARPLTRFQIEFP